MVASKGGFDCLSANFPFQKFLEAINFRLTRTTKRLHPVTATRTFLPHAIKYHEICECLRGKWPIVSLVFTTFMANSSTELSGSGSA